MRLSFCCQGGGLIRISARDHDGNAEVIEDPGRDFYLATRFHPESLYQTEPLMDKIIQAFINAADRYSTSKKSKSSSKAKSTGTI